MTSSSPNASTPSRFAALLVFTFLAGCGGSPESTEPAGSQGNSEPTEHTRRAHQLALQALPLADPADFADADRGLLARDPEVVVNDASGNRIWNTTDYAFQEGDAPASVHPSLWRQAQLNNRHGLYEVVAGVYQVRGYDLSTMSIIVGRSGWIIVDPLTTRETAEAALALARKHLGEAPVVAVILTHSHIDHFGGLEAVVSAEDAATGRVRIVAPQGFVEEATSENVLAGPAMGRRAAFMYGFGLERGPRGHVDSGLGKEPARGSFSVLPPTDIVDRTPQAMEIDGVRFVFQFAPESEAPAELSFYLPDKKAWCAAELVSHTMHNLYTLRGAKVRDALKWSGYIDEAIRLFGDAEVVFGSHNWPTWENQRVLEFLATQRDMYKYMHDQTLRLANAGLTSREIAEAIEFPEALRTGFASRGYYGTLKHNAKAVYQWYFGWYDGNPANLDPLPPEPAARKYVEFMGGAAAVLEKARASFDAGEYRWTATVLDHLIFADPGNGDARELLARTYDQLGYQSESAPWRDVYLTGALELRRGPVASPIDLAAAGGMLRYMPVERFFDSMAARIDGEKAAEADMTVNFTFTDLDQTYVLRVRNGVLNYRRGEADPAADATMRLTRDLWLRLVIGEAGLREMIFSDDLEVTGSRMTLLSFFSLLDDPKGTFNIVTP
jgi:alkyl sulfatase BDS1-like metallo-beta-lactamase superfamily hydrolase